MNAPLTICDVLLQSGAQVTFFDMGRRVVEIPLETIRRFENADIPYPQPFLRQAWLGILLDYSNSPQEEKHGARDNDNPDPGNIWFIKFPVDEQGLLLLAARDDFLRRLLETMAMAANPGASSIEDNPYGFTPREDKMAIFHAKISRLLGEPPSQFYAHAHDYFSGQTGFDQWNFVGLQGIADVAARLDEDDNTHILANAIAHLPAIPFAALCSCLEHFVPDNLLTREIASRIDKATKEADANIVAAGIRGLSSSGDPEILSTILHAVLSHPVGKNVEVLAAIAGRCWQILENSELRLLFLETLASCEAGQQAFDSILADLLFMPGLRQSLKADFNHPERSTQLAGAIKNFLKTAQTGQPIQQN